MITNKRIPLKYIVKSTYKDFLIVTIFSFVAFIIHLNIDFFTIPMSISTFLGTAISLILSFNLSLSYDRWWEARKIWGEIVNDSRALLLQLQTFSPNSNEVKNKKIKTLAYYQIAWVHTLALNLRGQNLTQDVSKYLSDKENEELKNAHHHVLKINSFIKNHLHTFEHLNSYEKVQIDTTLMRLVGHLGKAERIKKTIFPKEYQLVLHLSIYLFLGFLSFSLANLGHHWEIFLLIIIAAPFFLLEKTATHLQDPFENKATDVPISLISKNIEINLLELLGEDNLPEPIKEQGFYVN
jgi:ion channel-forming bestrophin family protein